MNDIILPVRVGYVYGLFDIKRQELWDCRYIGKTVTEPAERRMRHIQEALRGGPNPRCEWIRQVLSSGGDIGLTVIEQMTHQDRDTVDRQIKSREREWIACGRHLGWPLTNDTDGGEGNAIGRLVRGVDICTEPDCLNVISCRELCEVHYKRLRLYGSTAEPPPRYPELGERFWSKVDIRDVDECWEWQASFGTGGYGQFQMGGHKGKPHKATRIALMLSGIEVPDDLNALHTCDNRACVNPNHLYMGTMQDNVDDMKERGRMVVGEAHPLSKLTEDDVRAIRTLVANGQSMTRTAKEFGVNHMTISKIIHGRSWKHVV